jgi:hypothetical protein
MEEMRNPYTILVGAISVLTKHVVPRSESDLKEIEHAGNLGVDGKIMYLRKTV